MRVYQRCNWLIQENHYNWIYFLKDVIQSGKMRWQIFQVSAWPSSETRDIRHFRWRSEVKGNFGYRRAFSDHKRAINTIKPFALSFFGGVTHFVAVLYGSVELKQLHL